MFNLYCNAPLAMANKHWQHFYPAFDVKLLMVYKAKTTYCCVFSLLTCPHKLVFIFFNVLICIKLLLHSTFNKKKKFN